MNQLADFVREASSADRRIEIRLSDGYQRTKRNALLATAVAILIGLAGGTSTKIPGLSDAGLPVAGAVVLVWIASMVFTREFMNEWRMAFVRNSGIAASIPSSDLDDLFVARREQESGTTGAYVRAAEQFEAVIEKVGLPLEVVSGDLDLNALRRRVIDLRASLKDLRWPAAQIIDGSDPLHRALELSNAILLLDTQAEELEEEIRGWEQKSRRAREGFEQFRADARNLKAGVESRHREDDALVRLFGTLHASIHRIQRRSIYEDWLWVSGMIACATLVTAYHVSSWAYAVRCEGVPLCALLEWLR